jgi:hypothetical protein
VPGADSTETIALTLLDRRTGHLNRVRRSGRDGRLTLEVFFEDAAGTRDYGFSTLLLPLHGGMSGKGAKGPLVLTEGVPAVRALRAQGIHALGTQTGPCMMHAAEAMRAILSAGPVVLWPLPDPLGWSHMEQVASQLLRLGGKGTRMVTDEEDPVHTADAAQIVQRAVAWQPSLGVPPPRLRLPRTPVRVARLRLSPDQEGQPRLARPATATRLSEVRRLAEQVRPHLLRALRDAPASVEERRRLGEVSRRLYASLGVPLEP